jgi:hypothetical protein
VPYGDRRSFEELGVRVVWMNVAGAVGHARSQYSTEAYSVPTPSGRRWAAVSERAAVLTPKSGIMETVARQRPLWRNRVDLFTVIRAEDLEGTLAKQACALHAGGFRIASARQTASCMGARLGLAVIQRYSRRKCRPEGLPDNCLLEGPDFFLELGWPLPRCCKLLHDIMGIHASN